MMPHRLWARIDAFSCLYNVFKPPYAFPFRFRPPRLCSVARGPERGGDDGPRFRDGPHLRALSSPPGSRSAGGSPPSGPHPPLAAPPHPLRRTPLLIHELPPLPAQRLIVVVVSAHLRASRLPLAAGWPVPTPRLLAEPPARRPHSLTVHTASCHLLQWRTAKLQYNLVVSSLGRAGAGISAQRAPMGTCAAPLREIKTGRAPHHEILPAPQPPSLERV